MNQLLRGSLAAMRRLQISPWVLAGACALLPCPARAAVHVTLTNGFDLVCDHTGAAGTQTRLYMDTSATNYIVVATSAIRSAQSVAAPAPQTALEETASAPPAPAYPPVLSSSQLSGMLAGPGHAHDLDTDLLLSVVHAESAGRIDARSHAGAEGLMQLMPGTARQLGVADAWAPGENVSGGTAYLDALLHRYHDDLALALAAYNAGPAAVDRWHGIPPYRETRAYVARIIHEYNRRYRARQAAAGREGTVLAMAAPAIHQRP